MIFIIRKNDYGETIDLGYYSKREDAELIKLILSEEIESERAESLKRIGKNYSDKEIQRENRDVENNKIKIEALPKACRLLFLAWKESKKEVINAQKEISKIIVEMASKQQFLRNIELEGLDNYIYINIKNYILDKFKEATLEDKERAIMYFIYLIYYNYFSIKYKCDSNSRKLIEEKDTEEDWINYFKREELRKSKLNKKFEVAKKVILS